MSMTTITPDHLYFLTVSVIAGKNKLQLAIIADCKQYSQQILQTSPEGLAVKIVDAVANFNTGHPRCKPEEVKFGRAYGMAAEGEPIYISIGDFAFVKITPIMGEIAL